MNVPEIFASLVFNDSVMREKLPAEVYRQLRDTIENGGDLDRGTANSIAAAMKDWALEKGATHYTHWFQPMTGITAEKHDSFISPQPDGSVIMEFSGKELIKGEPDASSFPSGGLRGTFEARGYTAWDPTSYAFIKDDSLCIPTVFCSYSGQVLDKKTPLLRSIELIDKQALRIVRLFGDKETKHVNVTVGPEQEYFLVDRKAYDRRRDLVITGRTLFGAKPPKGQEMEDHYFGAIRPRVMEFMEDLNVELWKLGVYAKTEHNEAAPAQHELAPVFAECNIATDQNQLTMEVMKKVAERHGLACLLHEKPFAGVNGSGKHDNWSLKTDTGRNIFKPGLEPEKNREFLLFLCAVIKAVDENQDLLRISVSTAGNDHRLGANEAPPAIISMFLGEDLTGILNDIASGNGAHHNDGQKTKIGVDVITDFWKDKSDRNRTSPFAFTGNKFEFRMPGSQLSIAGPNIIINTIVADVLSGFADRLEAAADFDSELTALMRETINEHHRIIFNGNNYTEEWREEAHKRGLLDLPSAVDALPLFTSAKNIALFTRHNIFTEAELRSRREILLDNYCKVLQIEATTTLDMAKKDILPAALAYSGELAETAGAKERLGLDVKDSAEMKLLRRIDALSRELDRRTGVLEERLSCAKAVAGTLETARYIRGEVDPAMHMVRETADELETVVSAKYWPYPTYCELLFSV